MWIFSEKFSPAVLESFRKLQSELKLSDRIINYIIAYIGFECNFDPTVKNKITHTHHTVAGYINYLPRAIRNKLSIKSTRIGELPPEDQILILIQYLTPHRNKLIEMINVVGVLIDPKYVNGTRETNVYNSKLQFRFYRSGGHLPLGEILDKVESIYNKGLAEWKREK